MVKFGYNIAKHADIMSMQGKYPVIYLTFKDEKYSAWDDCKTGIENILYIGIAFQGKELLVKQGY